MAKGSQTMTTWSTADPDYDIDNFYTASEDKHGHSAHVAIRVSKTMAAVMQQVLESRQFPAYTTTSDIVRDAIYHRLRHLMYERKDFTPTPEMQFLVSVERQAEQAKRAMDIVNSVETLFQTVNMMQEVGDDDDARDLVKDVYTRAGKMLTGQALKIYRKRLVNRFPYLTEKDGTK